MHRPVHWDLASHEVPGGPVHRYMVVAVLQSRQQALAELLDGLALVVATMACLWPGEGATLQVCDVW